ncbi:MAG: hypothetical protein KJ587_09540 [Alphaproteobacteria bacterium]|nr:hypothetical protein [Alphaproteobacteria bacterium]
MQQLLYIETILKLSGGLVLLLLPLTACSIFGLPKPQTGLWPRLLGAVLIGIAGATYVEGATTVHGLGMAGCVVINMVAVAVILTLLILGAAGSAHRGRWILALLALGLSGLSFLELGQI